MSKETINETVLTPKRKPKITYMKILFLIGSIAVLLVAIIYEFNIYLYSYQYDNFIEKAQNYIKEQNYEEAILSFQNATEIFPKKSIAYEYLTEAAILDNQPDLAKKTYQTLYEITDNSKYIYLADSVYSGANIGNTSNGGYVVEKGSSTYLLDKENKFVDLWKISNNNLYFIKHIYYNRENKNSNPSMNIWGNYYYYLNLNGSILRFNLANEMTETIQYQNSNQSQASDFQIYNNEIYYIETRFSFSRELPLINRRTVISGLYTELPIEGNFEHIYLVDERLFYLTTESDGYALYETLIDSISPHCIYKDENRQIINITYSNKKLYFNFLDSTQGIFYPEIGVYDINSGKVTIEPKDSPIDALNSNESNIFYISNGKLYQESLDFLDKQELYVIKSESNKKTSINLTGDTLYLISYDTTDPQNTFGENIKYKFAALDDPTVFKNLELIVYPEISKEVKQAYKEFLSTLSQSAENMDSEQSSFTGGSFFFFDMNEDGIHEMIVRQNDESDFNLYHFYTYENGKVVKIIDPIKAKLVLFSGENDPHSGQLISYTSEDFGETFKKSYVNYDGRTIQFEPKEIIYKAKKYHILKTGYNIPLSGIDSDFFFK